LTTSDWIDLSLGGFGYEWESLRLLKRLNIQVNIQFVPKKVMLIQQSHIEYLVNLGFPEPRVIFEV